MELISNTVSLPKKNFVATIGFFDGVHKGHQFLLNHLKEEAKKLGKQSLVISFKRHPKTVVTGKYVPQLLTSNSEKIELFESLGIDSCILLDFDHEMAQLTAHGFLKQIIAEQLGVHTLLIGYDNRFGKNREESIDDYIRYGKELGINIVPVGSYHKNETHISSTVIRKLLLEGKIEEANKFMNKPFCISGKVIEGEKLGRKIGFPTANIELTEKFKIIPAHGVYAIQAQIGSELYKGMLNIGTRPTVSNNKTTSIEVHILDFDKSIYAQEIKLIFVQKIRDEIKFNSLEELISQLEKDKTYVVNLDYKLAQ